MVGISVTLVVEHLHTASVPSTISTVEKPKIILIPNLDNRLTVRSTIKQFVEEFLYIPAHIQSLSAPVFTKVGDDESVEEIYSKYDCQAEAESPSLHFEEDTYTFWGLECGKSVELQDLARLQDYHILHKSTIRLKTLPEPLAAKGGRIFVETKDGILPLVGVSPSTRVLELKRNLEDLTGIPVAQQLLSSIGRVMHDEFHLKDFEGFHAIYEGSVIDLCKSGDSNMDQAHRKMIVYLHVSNEQILTLVVQPSDSVQSIMQIVESRLRIPQWKQRIIFNGKILQETRLLAEYFIYPECTIKVNVLKSPGRTPARSTWNAQSEDNPELHLEESVPRPAARKFKLVRTQSGHVKGTITIPVLTTDKISDLRRKIKRSLQLSGERNTPTSSNTPVKEQQSQNDLMTRICPGPSTGNAKPSHPVYEDKKRTSTIELLTKQMASTGCLKSKPSKQATPPRTPNSYITPPQPKDSFFTPPTKLGPPTPSSPQTSDTTKASSFIRKLHFGNSSDTPLAESCASSNQPGNTPLKQIFPQITRQFSLNRSSTKAHAQRGSGQHGSLASNEHESENIPVQMNVGSEKKSIASWLTENIHTLKGHIRSPFAEK